MVWIRNVFIGSVVLVISLLTSCHNSDGMIDDLCEGSSLNICVKEMLNSGCAGEAGKIFVGSTGGIGNVLYSMNDSVFRDDGKFDGVKPGRHKLSVIDDNGCHAEVITILDNSDLSINVKNISHVDCSTDSGQFDAEGSGGVGSFQYRIDQGEFQSNGSFTGLVAGIYTLTMKDEMECIANDIVEIEDSERINIDQIVSTEVSNCMLSDGSLNVNVSGGDGNYMYKIDEGQFQSEMEFIELGSGEYLITVVDGRGCTALEMATVNEREGVGLKKVISLFPACDSLSAKLIVQAQGGVGEYEYKLGVGDYQFSNEFENLKLGSYEVFVKDQLGCSISKKHEIKYAVSFVDINKLLTANCTFEPCHNGSNNLIDLIEINDIKKYESQIIQKVTFGNETSKNGKLSEDEVNQIVCWFEKGAVSG